jgi:polyphosphate kinase 2 (PPK2 family)
VAKADKKKQKKSKKAKSKASPKHPERHVFHHISEAEGSSKLPKKKYEKELARLQLELVKNAVLGQAHWHSDCGAV